MVLAVGPVRLAGLVAWVVIHAVRLPLYVLVMVMQRRRPPPGYYDVTHCQDWTDEEREFVLALDRYKRENRRPFPTWREVLWVIKELGYRKDAK